MKTRTSATLAVISLGLMYLAQPALAATTQVATATSLDNLHVGNTHVSLIEVKGQCTFSGNLQRAEADGVFKVDVELKSCPNDVGTLVEEIKGTVILGEFPIVPPCEDDKDCYRALEAGAVASLEYSK